MTEPSPISFEVDVRRLPDKGFPITIEADAAQRAGLASSHGLLSVDALHAELLVKRWKRDGISVTGRVVASIVQACVATLEPVPATIDEEVETVFVPPSSNLAKPRYHDGELFLAADGPDVPEIFEGNTIDVGALTEEFFGLAIDPYPRSSASVVTMTEAGVPTESPFAVLASRLNRE